MNKCLADGRYILCEVVGEGGMATVHRAWDRVRGRWCAIKMLSPVMAMHEDPKARFRREARTLDGLAHPNIVSVQELCEDGRIFFLVMDLVDGGSVAEWVARHGPMSPRQAVTVGIDICAGLGAAHAQGVVHRDIKPDNVLIGQEGCRLVDFGIAQLRDAHTEITRTGIRMGTLGFISPEQMVDAKKVDEQADIYSVGATLLFLMSAEVPMPMSKKLVAHAPKMGEGLARIIAHATRMDPGERHWNIGLLEEELGRVHAELPVTDGPPLHHGRPLPAAPSEEAWA
jgi:serine/threonine-protein kinase